MLKSLPLNAIMHIILHGHFIYLQPLQISTICYNPTMKKEIYKRIALFAAMVSMLITFCASCGYLQSGSVQGGIYINEAMSSNSLTLIDESLGSADWVEFYNSTGRPVNLNGYGLSDNIREPGKWRFPDVTIGAGEYLIVFFSKYSGDLPDGVLCTGFGLSRAGEIICFTDENYNIIQQMELPALKPDMSWARRDDGGYGYCGAATPGEHNSTDIVDSIDDVVGFLGGNGLVISEVMPVNDASYEFDAGYYPWLELHNPTDKEISLGEYMLSDDPNRLDRWRIPSVNLEPGGYTVIYISGRDSQDGQLHTSFKLGSDEFGVYLTNNAGELCSYLTWEEGIFDGVAVTSSGYTVYATPGAENSREVFSSLSITTMGAEDPIRINEVLPKNQYSVMDSDGDRPEWVELYNSSQNSVSLGKYYLSDNVGNHTKWALPDIELKPGEYLLIYLSGKDRRDGELHASFGLSDRDSVLTLFCIDGMRIDTIELPENIGKNVSIGRDSSGRQVYYSQPTPNGENNTRSFDSADMVSLTDMNGLYISEVCGVNTPKSGQDDWIELHNAGGNDIDLTGWYLSDDVDNPLGYTLPDLTVKAGGYAVIYASDSTRPSGKPYVGFGLSGSGETLILSDPNGVVYDVFHTGALRSGVTSGRLAGSDGRVFFASASKGYSNDSPAYSGYVSEPLFSNRELYHSSGFELSISCRTAGATIYYTLDGTEPTERSEQYTGPIEIDKNAVVRAIATADGRLDSEIATSTYLFEKPHTLPVVCLTFDPADFSAVYAATTRDQRVERGAFVEYYESDGGLGVKFPCGVRANGSGTLVAPQKSLAIKLRAGYGRQEVTYPFFGEYEIKSFQNLVLRYSGQDRDGARVRDAVCMRMVEGLNIDNCATRPVVAYINGKYWGIYDLNEDQNADFLAAHYGVNPDEVDIIRRNTGALEGSSADIKRVRDFAGSRNLSNDELFKQYLEWVDVDYFTDYLIAQIYFCNGDMFNQKYWRSHDYRVKWRPVFYDLDFGLSGSQNLLYDYFNPVGVPSANGSLTDMRLYVGLEKNAEWREFFIERYIYVMYNVLTPERMVTILNDYVKELEPEMERHIKRWYSPRSMDLWNSKVEAVKSFIMNRREKAISQLKGYFDLSDSQIQEYVNKATKEHS